jgi:hypothetical protein
VGVELLLTEDGLGQELSKSFEPLDLLTGVSYAIR